ncbi:MAG TPA: hypothetical protein VK616_06300 [Flavitalea sp.]|nr:hypothetical protein [Flavitalea sp.]
MEFDVITKEDLQQFRVQLLHDLRQILEPSKAKSVKPLAKKLRGSETSEYLL